MKKLMKMVLSAWCLVLGAGVVMDLEGAALSIDDNA